MPDSLLAADLPILLSAVEASGASLIITDQEKKGHPIIYCNAAFEKLTGYGRAEILGRNCRFLQGDDRAQIELDHIRRAFKKRTGCVVKLRNYRKDGSTFLNELSLSPVRSDGGEITQMVGIQREIIPTGEQFSHDLGTPLTTIKATLQLIEARGLSIEPQFLKKSLAAALRAVHQLEALRNKS
ncbi:PAS domain-containing protein [Mucilaginibacter sp.]|jgi:PAS domain S-box-containing protein|uniref:PAS domain-containing protein n=1 Tax=Mucilaginibacter sp. TaxID=1882438 RepID=UPI002CFA67CD|nr:PAS domain-containing protein [Mucilaginibacter sp.]HTI58138.1 PAS domain-containing protein [Mucilaginibacter sp.]